jgi:hypothetical protein
VKSLTLEEELAAKYHIPTRGMQPKPHALWDFVFDGAHRVAFPKDARQRLNAGVHATSRVGIFGADDWATNDGVLHFHHVCPEIGGAGWGKRWPGADHWEVTRNGKPYFRTQNYGYVLKFLQQYVTKNPQPPRPNESNNVASDDRSTDARRVPAGNSKVRTSKASADRRGVGGKAPTRKRKARGSQSEAAAQA